MNTQQSQSPHKKLYRSRTDKKVAGVCGGVAEYFHIDATVVRLIFIVVTLASGFFPAVLAYLVAAVVIPEEPTASTPQP